MTHNTFNRLARPLVRLVTIAAVATIATSSVALAQDETDRIEEIEREVADIRGLEVLTPIEITYLSREDYQNQTADDFTTDYPEEDVARDQRTMVAFGILESGTDLRALYSDLYGGQVLGYYDPTTSELVVIRDGEDEDLTAMEEFTLAHEINHALQDQHFDIDAGVFDTENLTDDASLAIDGLVEGDAVLLQGIYLQANPAFARDLLDEYNDEDATDDALDGFPPVIVALLYFPYNEGYEFTQALYDEGGFELVDEAFANPPTTTEQILHPEKYLDGEIGQEITVVDPSAVLGGAWAQTDENAFGEYLISQLLLSEGVDDDDAEDAAEGWNGDAYKVAGDGDQSAVIWASAWDSDDDAEEFAEATAERETNRLDAHADEDDGTWTIESEEGAVVIRLDGDQVVYAFAPTIDQATQLLDGQIAG